MEYEKELLDKYYNYYVVNKFKAIEFGGYNVNNPDFMGSCKIGNPCIIKIQPCFKGHKFWSKVILWHEFCHAWAYIDDNYKGEHGIEWLSKCIIKPLLFLAQVPCCFAYIILQLVE